MQKLNKLENPLQDILDAVGVEQFTDDGLLSYNMCLHQATGEYYGKGMEPLIRVEKVSIPYWVMR